MSNFRRVVTTGGVIIVIVVLAVFLVRQYTSDQLSSAAMQNVLLAILATMLPLVLAQLSIALRMAVLLGEVKSRFTVSLKAGLFAQGTDLFLPWRLSEVVKVAYVHLVGKVSVAQALSVTVTERISDLIVVSFLAGLVLVYTSIGLTVWTFAGISVLGAVGLVSLWLLRPMWEAIIRVFPFAALRNFALSTLDVTVKQLENGSFLIALVLGISAWFFTAVSTHIFLFIAMPYWGVEPPTFILSLGLLIAVTLGNIVAVLPASLGTFEAAAVLVLRGFGLDLEPAIVLAVALHIAFLLPGVIGAAVVMYNDRGLLGKVLALVKKLRKQKPEAL